MRRFISTLSTIVLALVCFTGTGNAANFSDKSIGISIDLDDELVEQSQKHGYLIFSTTDNSASVLIKPLYELDLYKLRESLKDGRWRSGGVNLNVIDSEQSSRVSYGSGILVPVKGSIGEYKINGVFGGFSGFGDQNFLVIGAARPDYWNEWKPRMKAMFESISFIEIDYSEMIKNWKQRLIGKRLAAKIAVPPGQMAPKPINLCDNGIVADEQPANTKPAATAPQRTVWNGVTWVTVPVVPMPRPPVRWNTVPIRGKPTLVIHEGPRPLEFVLELEGDQLLLNGRPHDMTESKLCQ